MLNKINYKKKSIPKKWFFFNLAIKDNRNILFSLDKRVGVVFFYKNNKSENSLFEKMGPLVSFCKKKGIDFVIPFSSYWARKYKAFGVLIEKDDMIANNTKILKVLKKRFKIICKVHNKIEAIQKKEIADIFFISPVYPSNSHPGQAPLKNYIFLRLCHFLKKKDIYALGGMNDKNFKLKNSTLILGYGGINSFRK